MRKTPASKIRQRAKPKPTHRTSAFYRDRAVGWVLAEEPSPYIARKRSAKQQIIALTEESITEAVLGAAQQVYTELGSSLSRSAYEIVLAHHLTALSLPVERKAPAFLVQEEPPHKGTAQTALIVAGLAVVKLEVVPVLAPIHSKRLMRDLLVLNMRLGLLINFGGSSLDDNMRRVINGSA